MIQTNRIAILKKDNSEHEIVQNFEKKDYILQGNVKVYLDTIPGQYTEEVVALPKLMIMPLDEDWNNIRINFNLPAYNLVKNNQFFFEEREDGFDFELFEPIAKSKNVYRVSYRKRNFDMKSEVLDCQEGVWYKIDEVSKGRYSVKL